MKRKTSKLLLTTGIVVSLMVITVLLYKPSVFQQMGLLTGADGKILPLYGKESSAHRDRYNYYTTTPGNQVYSLPISHKDKDCTDDIGCGEFYGNENVSVTGMGGEFTAEIYRNKNIQLL